MEKRINDPLISIITPLHNSGNYIRETANTVLRQRYENWEWIVIDDCSTDDSVKIMQEIKKENASKKIKLIRLKKNSGAAKARNAGIEAASGTFLCFLDSDDLWDKDKIMKQLKFMQRCGCAFSFTSYEFADASGKPNGKKVFVPEKISYKQALKNTTIWTSTVMFDLEKLSKDDIMMPDVRRGQDTATWWKVLKKIDYAYGLNEVLSYYRRSAGSLSSNKLTALKRTWNLYRNVEHLSLAKSLYCFCFYCFNAIKRRM